MLMTAAAIGYPTYPAPIMAVSLDRVLDLVHEVRSATDVDSFAERALASLTELVPCGEITFNELDFERGEAEYERSVPGTILGTELGEYFWSHWNELPLCRPGVGEEGVWRTSDLITRARLHDLEVYDTMLRPFGVEFQVKVALAAPALRSRAFLLSRSDRDFSDREMELLELIRPHLAEAYWRVRASAQGLSGRETEILRLVRAGLTNRDIAAVLVLSPATVRTHLEHVFRKLGVHTRMAAVDAVSR